MDKNRIIIIALLLVIIALLAGLLLSTLNFAKTDSTLEIISDAIDEGDSIEIRLSDENGTALANQTVNITVTDKDNASNHHSVVTNDEGIGELSIDKGEGNYNVSADYGGNDRYNGCGTNKQITVNKVEDTTSQSSSSSLPYSIDNLPPSNDPYPETRRYQVDEYTVIQEYEDNYRSIVDLRTGERHGGFF